MDRICLQYSISGVITRMEGRLLLLGLAQVTEYKYCQLDGRPATKASIQY